MARWGTSKAGAQSTLQDDLKPRHGGLRLAECDVADIGAFFSRLELLPARASAPHRPSQGRRRTYATILDDELTPDRSSEG